MAHSLSKDQIVKNVFEYQWTSMKEYFGKPRMFDIDFSLNLFSNHRSESIQRLIDYMEQANDDKCMDDPVKKRISDTDVKRYLSKLGFSNSS